MERQVFVTGGTGYVGRPVVAALLARGHRVTALVRPGSEAKVPQGAVRLVGDPLNRTTFGLALTPAHTFLQLVGVPRPSPAKAQQFRAIDLRSALESITAARAVGIEHFIYVSVAQPAPIMRAYQAIRAEAEHALTLSGLRHTIVRPWYILGPGHRWPYALLPGYWLAARAAATRATAERLGLVTIAQMVHTLVQSVERPPATQRVIDVPEIRRAALP